MPRFATWLGIVVPALACSLSVDEGSLTDQDDPKASRVPPPMGNPFGSSATSGGGGGARSFATSGGGGAAGAHQLPVAAGGREADPSPGGRGPEARNPIQLPTPDAAVPRCASDAGACFEALCLSSDDCSDGLCINSRCRSFCDVDEDCPVGQACALGLCRTSPSPTWECYGVGDCASGEDCVSGGCLRRCSNDAHCSDSEDGAVCTLGYCGQ